MITKTLQDRPNHGDLKLVRRIQDCRAIVLPDQNIQDQFIAIPFADRRRRPIAWLSRQAVQRLVRLDLIRSVKQKSNEGFAPNVVRLDGAKLGRIEHFVECV